jgi:hypothetical protein
MIAFRGKLAFNLCLMQHEAYAAPADDAASPASLDKNSSKTLEAVTDAHL